MKTCTKCGQNKSIEDFYKTGKGDKRHGSCKECYKKAVAANKDPVKCRELELKRKYGIGTEEYEEMLKKQNSKCAICLGDDPKSPARVNHWYVDHCHDTGKVRGLLCNACNRALGNFGDSIANLERAILYLKQ